MTVLESATLIKNRLQHRCFPVNIAKLLRRPVLKNICERLLLFLGVIKAFKNIHVTPFLILLWDLSENVNT